MRAFDIYARYRYTYVRIICIIREFLKTKAMLKVCQQAWQPMKHANCSESSIWYNCNKNDENGDSCNKKTGPKANTGRKKWCRRHHYPHYSSIWWEKYILIIIHDQESKPIFLVVGSGAAGNIPAPEHSDFFSPVHRIFLSTQKIFYINSRGHCWLKNWIFWSQT